ncbi:MAG: HAMP domain-containing histidine kinase [Salinisphaera sp.]|nr:HAMP domain-containing histidine kinase [Salinisphaera sp.]
MPRSITRRVHRTVFTISLVSLVITVGMIYLGYHQMEQSMLAIEIKAERDSLLENLDTTTPSTWDTAEFKAYYTPGNRAVQRFLPALFRGLPVPFSGEIEFDNETFLVAIGKAGGGRLYMAKNITLFERREALFSGLLVVVCLGVVALSFILARVNSRRLVTPLQKLAGHIGNTAPGPRMPRLPPRFEDAELATIATTFNAFLDELEAYVKREQSLLGLASHELRTPIAVIGGALDVIQRRGRLGADDRRTLERAQRASAEMHANVDVVLKLARRTEQADPAVAIDLAAMTRDLVQEIDHAGHRVALQLAASAPVIADPVLVKMLLRNLIGNALQHTKGNVQVGIGPEQVEIADQGGGLPARYHRLLAGESLSSGDVASLSGLGLFLVMLICERLGWRIEIPHSSTRGTTLWVRYKHNDGLSNPQGDGSSSASGRQRRGR